MFMPAPTYQAGLGFASRGVPDLALLAGLPGVGTCSELPGQIDPVEGTSVASPLSAGFLALISSRLGCHTGDPHVALYALGFAEQDGGAAVFNQITSGNNGYGGVPGYDAGPGYNLATGWGSLNVAVMAGAWPGCPVETDGGLFEVDAGTTPSTEGDDAGPAYAQCAFIDCAPADCDTIPEGPSSCSPVCDALDAGSCATGLICSNDVIFSSGLDAGTGACVPGCINDSDCAADGGTPVCDSCEEVCTAPGNSSAQIGDGCASPSDCPTNGTCTTRRGFDGGYCTQACIPAGQPGANVCNCPAGSDCELYGRSGEASAECLLACTDLGGPCAREGYLCQRLSDGTGACLPPCALRTSGGGGAPLDTCTEYGANNTFACDVDSGYCGGPAVDAGPDAGPTPVPDAGSGTPDAGTPQDAGTVAPFDAGTVVSPITKNGCSCSSGPGTPESGLFLLALVLLRRKRRIA
jgi:MYXO-CTERM domain-containing protein